MSLYRAELRRFSKRRFVRYSCLAAVLLLVVIAVAAFFLHEQVGPERIAAAQTEAEQQYQADVRNSEPVVRDCEAAKAAGTPRPDLPSNCADLVPQPELYRAADFLPATFAFRDNYEAMLYGFAAIMGLTAFLVGATFVGAEWTSGGMMNLLLWRPRRLVVLLTKLVALLVGLTTFVLAAGALYTGGLLLIARYKGNTDAMTPGVWQSFGLTGLRAVALILVFAVLGFGLASLGRRTAMALGAALGFVVVGLSTGIVASIARASFPDAYLATTYLGAWMGKSVTLENYECASPALAGCTMQVTWQMAGGLFGAILLLVLGAAMWTMRRREIT